MIGFNMENLMMALHQFLTGIGTYSLISNTFIEVAAMHPILTDLLRSYKDHKQCV